MTETTDKVIAKLNSAAIKAGMTDEARAAWASGNASIYAPNIEGKIRRVDKPDVSPKKSLKALRKTTPDAFNADAPDLRNSKIDKVAASKNPWLLGPDRGHDERLRIISTLGTKVAQQLAQAAQTDLAARPLRKKA